MSSNLGRNHLRMAKGAMGLPSKEATRSTDISCGLNMVVTGLSTTLTGTGFSVLIAVHSSAVSHSLTEP